MDKQHYIAEVGAPARLLSMLLGEAVGVAFAMIGVRALFNQAPPSRAEADREMAVQLPPPRESQL